MKKFNTKNMQSFAHRKARKRSSVNNEHVGGTMASADHGDKSKLVDELSSRLVETMRKASFTAEQMEFKVQNVIEGAGLVPTTRCCARVATRCEDLIDGGISLKSFKKYVVRDLLPLAAADVSPLNRIFDEATVFAGKYPVFSTTNGTRSFKQRYCECSSFIETPLVMDVRELLMMREGASTPLPLIGGPSGGGKTMAVISLSSKEAKTIVAYIIRSDDLREHLAAPPTAACADSTTTERDQRMTEYLIDELYGAIPHSAWPYISKLASPDRLRLLVFLDEMGGEDCAEAVRALCRINDPQQLRTKLEAKTKLALPQVDLRLAVAGTGISVGDEAPGSLEGSYTMLYAYDGSVDGAEAHMAGNRAIFSTFFSLVPGETEELKPHVSPFFWRMMSENARMSAILGKEVRKSLDLLKEEDKLLCLRSMDLHQFLGPAFCQFKSRNALNELRLENVEEVLLKVIRMHWFPRELTVDTDKMRTKYGLIVDRTMEKDAYSPNVFPFFTTAVLSMLSGNPIVSQSLVSGAPLEEYASVLMYLLACAANDGDLFLKALDEHGGSLAPITQGSLGADSISSNSNMRPTNEARSFASLIHDMGSSGDDPEVSLESSAPPNVNVRRADLPESLQTILRSARARLSKVFKGLSAGLHIAAFKTPDKAPFADAILFIGTRMFLFQMKDMEGGYKLEGFEEERWKMGSLINSEVAELLVGIESIANREKPDESSSEYLDLLKRVAEKMAVGEPALSDTDSGNARLAVSKTARSEERSVEQRQEAYFDKINAAAEHVRSLLQAAGNPEQAKESAEAAISHFDEAAAERCGGDWFLGPRRLVKALVGEWYEATGAKITHVHRVFVTPKPIAETTGAPSITDETFSVTAAGGGESWSVVMDKRDRFVSVERVRFMPFDGRRHTRASSYLQISARRTMAITKHPQKAPDLPSAAASCTTGRANAPKRSRSSSSSSYSPSSSSSLYDL